MQAISPILNQPAEIRERGLSLRNLRTVADVVRATADLTGHAPAQLMSNARARGTELIARAVIAVVCRDFLGMSTLHIGAEIGRNHSTVLNSYDRHGKAPETTALVRRVIERLHGATPTEQHKGHGTMAQHTQQLKMQAELARSLLVAIAETITSDDQAKHDAIEGETGYFEAVDKVLDRISALETMAEALESQMATLKSRKERMEKSIETMREHLKSAMTSIGETTVERPRATLTVRDAARSVLILDPEKIPEQYLRKPPPQPDKTQIAKRLKDGFIVPGAVLSNGGTSIQIRFG